MAHEKNRSVERVSAGKPNKTIITGDRRARRFAGENGKTELEAASTPNLDKLASKGEAGLLQMVEPGLPGQRSRHLALFGYDPLDFRIGRGILEALGVGAQVAPQDVCVRGKLRDLGP